MFKFNNNMTIKVHFKWDFMGKNPLSALDLNPWPSDSHFNPGYYVPYKFRFMFVSCAAFKNSSTLQLFSFFLWDVWMRILCRTPKNFTLLIQIDEVWNPDKISTRVISRNNLCVCALLNWSLLRKREEKKWKKKQQVGQTNQLWSKNLVVWLLSKW